MTEDEDMLMIRACLVACARRLRHYERQHLQQQEGTASMVKRQEAKTNAEIDDQLATMAESFLRAQPPDVVAKQPDPV